MEDKDNKSKDLLAYIEFNESVHKMKQQEVDASERFREYLKQKELEIKIGERK